MEKNQVRKKNVFTIDFWIILKKNENAGVFTWIQRQGRGQERQKVEFQATEMALYGSFS